MFARLLTNAAVAGCVLLGVVAVLAAPGIALTGAMFGLVVGAVTGRWVRDNASGDAASTARAGRRGGLLVGAGVFGGWLALTGLILLLGPASGAVLGALTIVVCTAWLGGRPNRRIAVHTNPWAAVRNRLLGAAHQPDRPSSGQPLSEAEGSAPEPVTAATPIVADLSTAELCSAWHRTYFVLVDLPTGGQHTALVHRRRGLLDEIERRDPDGFARWLDTGARAGSDPGRYLAGDR